MIDNAVQTSRGAAEPVRVFGDIVHIYNVTARKSMLNPEGFLIGHGGFDLFVPRSVVLPYSSVWQAGQTGTLIVTREFADLAGISTATKLGRQNNTTTSAAAPAPANVEKPADPDVEAVIAEISALIRAKNRKYGNSALNPVRVFSQADVDEQLRVRIDDKLSRLSRGVGPADDEDTVLDLIGYLVLLRAAQRKRLARRLRVDDGRRLSADDLRELERGTR